jgi:hypothetical protein
VPTLDLTSSTRFVLDLIRHAQICKHARTLKVMIPFRNGTINLGVALELLFKALHSLYHFWTRRDMLTPADLLRPGLGCV